MGGVVTTPGGWGGGKTKDEKDSKDNNVKTPEPPIRGLSIFLVSLLLRPSPPSSARTICTTTSMCPVCGNRSKKVKLSIR